MQKIEATSTKAITSNRSIINNISTWYQLVAITDFRKNHFSLERFLLLLARGYSISLAHVADAFSCIFQTEVTRRIKSPSLFSWGAGCRTLLYVHLMAITVGARACVRYILYLLPLRQFSIIFRFCIFYATFIVHGANHGSFRALFCVGKFDSEGRRGMKDSEFQE